MKKLINKPEHFVDEMLEGIYLAHKDQVTYVGEDRRCLVAKKKVQGKVGIATGGGSGHLPLFLGYVGEGLLDGCAIGGVFQSPSGMQMLEVTKHIDTGAGVLYIYGNYNGDIMNFDMAKDMAEMENIRVEQVVAGEDVASAPKGKEDKRRGVAGIFYVYKIAGAYATEMANLEEVKRIAEKTCQNVRTMGVALSPCIVPEVGRASFHIDQDEMEIGMGIHGEPGIERSKLATADETATIMVNKILEDMVLEENTEVSVLMNGLGATPQEELYVLYRKVAEILAEKNIKVIRTFVGEFATSMEMAGASISILKLDDELKRLLLAPANTPFYTQV